MVLIDLMITPGDAPVFNDLPFSELAEVLLERIMVDFGGNDDNHLRVEQALLALVVNVEEVMEAENDAVANIDAETMQAVDLPCLSSSTPGIVKRGIDGQERIT